MTEKNISRKFKAEKLTVGIYKTRRDMGYAAAQDVANKIKELMETQDYVNIVFPCAVSQTEFFEELFKIEGIMWNRVNGFVMDEYIGLEEGSPLYLKNHAKEFIFGKVPFNNAFYFEGTNDPEEECARYSQLLREHPLDISCLGIGENGHLAYNDPAVADFNDPLLVKIVYIDEYSRNQAVHDGVFKTLNDVPKGALTITIPVMINAKYLSVVVPSSFKSQAIKDTIEGEISTKCPASILRKYDNAILYIDEAAAELLG